LSVSEFVEEGSIFPEASNLTKLGDELEHPSSEAQAMAMTAFCLDKTSNAFIRKIQTLSRRGDRVHVYESPYLRQRVP
jgi:hypothetical protein